jgi:DNA mismatch repair protein MutL
VPKIALLSPDISRKIAAGEVIERPFSVVKELVENSLDAGAASIRVELAAGGKSLVRIQDDGCGMSREDALLAFERHATSKIHEEADLERISTMGFRGEALASIAAVSRLILRTSEGGEKAVEVERQGDRLVAVRDVGLARGTTVEVRDLFFNLPARLKFLKSDTSELSQSTKWLTSIACGYFEVAFYLSHGPRLLFNWPRVKTLKERLYQVYGKDLIDRLMDMDYAEAGSRAYGLASRPPIGRADKSQQFFYVNRRPVRDRIMQAALNQAFRPLLEKNQYAEAFLFLTHPFGEVDVNVHPAKAEVRFRDTQAVFRIVLRSIENAVLHERTIKRIPFIARQGGERVQTLVEEPRPPHLFGDPYARPTTARPPRTESPMEFGASPGGGFKILGQYLDMYIVAASEEGIFIIDQHNAHEKVLFEKYKEIGREKSWPRQLALIPLLFDLSPSEVLSFDENKELFAASGFRVEEAGGRTYALKEYPDILRDEEAQQIFLSLLAEIKDEQLGGRQDKLLATLACRTAVKAGEPLSRVQMEYLVEELFKLPQQALCPHGRPVLLKMERGQIDRGLRRQSN